VARDVLYNNRHDKINKLLHKHAHSYLV